MSGLGLRVRADQPRFSALQFAIAAAAYLTALLTLVGAGLTSYVLLGLSPTAL